MNIDTSAVLAREALRKLVTSNVGPAEYLHEVSTHVNNVVGNDAFLWLTLDPDTMLSSGTLVTEQPVEYLHSLWRNELLEGDVNKLADLARLRSPVATIGQLDPASVAASPRLQLIHHPAGLGDELRVVLRTGGSVWGTGGLCRELGAPAFTARERAFVADVADGIARGLRHSLSRPAEDDPADLTPGVVAFDGDGTLVSQTADATRLIRLMPHDATSTLFSVAVSTLRHDSAGTRVRLVDGRWLLLQGGRMRGTTPGSELVTVSLMPAPRAQRTALQLRLHALSAREREIAELLIHGLRTDELAGRLHISPNTLRDHVKSIFSKVGARSRPELVALISDQQPQRVERPARGRDRPTRRGSRERREP